MKESCRYGADSLGFALIASFKTSIARGKSSWRLSNAATRKRQLGLAGIEGEHFLIGRERVLHLRVFFQAGAFHEIDQGIGFARVLRLKGQIFRRHERERIILRRSFFRRQWFGRIRFGAGDRDRGARDRCSKGREKQPAKKNMPDRCAAPVLPESHFEHCNGDGGDVQTRPRQRLTTQRRR